MPHVLAFARAQKSSGASVAVHVGEAFRKAMWTLQGLGRRHRIAEDAAGSRRMILGPSPGGDVVADQDVHNRALRNASGAMTGLENSPHGSWGGES